VFVETPASSRRFLFQHRKKLSGSRADQAGRGSLARSADPNSLARDRRPAWSARRTG